jgi:hypothetical protein
VVAELVIPAVGEHSERAIAVWLRSVHRVET